ncbi:hypothetical protein [Paludifilum halophilum]|uniref:Uncharacterized protein n=1 Tax=Paludifilum halophilum TaxID=1642702 RepID=A0A235BAT3_9BACL|nr:hypothetical protein [Paludifilum halophilum]OYD08987.1 hypothetical protein CHM34_04225 [Paludifilum halophilum]
MNKLMVISILVATVFIMSIQPVVYGSSTDDHKILSVQELNKKSKIEEMSEFISESGNSITIYGLINDKVPVLDLIFEKSVPMMLSPKEVEKHKADLEKKKGAEVKTINISSEEESSRNASSGPPTLKKTGQKKGMKSVSTSITVYNYNDEFFSFTENVAYPKSTDIEEIVTNKKIKEQVESLTGKTKVTQFKEHIKKIRKNHPKGKEVKVKTDAGTFVDAPILTSQREGLTYYAEDPTEGDIDVIGKYIADHTAYHAQDEDPEADYIIMKSHVGVYSGAAAVRDSEGELCSCNVGGYQGSFDNVYIGDLLMDWEPDTQAYDLDEDPTVWISSKHCSAIRMDR